jgi:hypothetical protein
MTATHDDALAQQLVVQLLRLAEDYPGCEIQIHDHPELTLTVTPRTSAPPPVPVQVCPAELRELLTALDAFRTRMTRDFDQIQATLAELIARDAEENRQVMNT